MGILRARLGGVLLAVSLVAAASPATGATFAVDSPADQIDAALGNGLCATAAGPCTLRAAVMEANALPGPDVVTLPAGTFRLPPTARTRTSA
jgi:hypothetical protein